VSTLQQSWEISVSQQMHFTAVTLC